MKEIFKPAVGMFGRQIIVTVMNIFVCISLMVLATAAFTENIGYNAAVYEEGAEKPVAEYTYYNSEGEDTKKAEYEEQGYTVSTSNIRSKLSGGGLVGYYVVTQIFALLIMTGFIYPNLWSLGAKDSNLVKFKHKNEDVLRGLKIGLVAVIPQILVLAAIFILGGKLFTVPIVALLNANYYSLITVLGGSAVFVGELSLWRILLIAVLPVIAAAIAAVAYLLGYKDISLGEKIVYKKQK